MEVYYELEIVSSDKIREFEIRIENLVESNKTKINRIKLLLEERNSLMAEIETINRLNHLLAESVDMYRADDDENVQNNAAKNADQIDLMDTQIGELKAENQTLSERISRLNQMNFDLKKENDKLNVVLATHSSQVLGEHNYIL